MPEGDTIARAAAVLHQAGFVATIRKTRGEDIDAACGQLAGEVQDRTRVQQRMTRAPVRIHARDATAVTGASDIEAHS